MEKQLIFRRINGRLVPMKVNKSDIRPGRPRKRQSKGKIAATMVGGVGASLFGGSAFAEFGAEAERLRDVSKAQYRQAKRLKVDPRAWRGQAKSFSRAAARSRLRSRTIFKQRNLIAGGALALGAFAFAKGLREAGESIKGDRLNFGEEAAVDLGGTLAIGVGSIALGKKLRVPRNRAFRVLKNFAVKGFK